MLHQFMKKKSHSNVKFVLTTVLKNCLKKHIVSVHEEERPFKCDICEFRCSQKGNMTTHVASVHEGKKPFKCGLCDYSCSANRSMKKHVASVHEEERPL